MATHTEFLKSREFVDLYNQAYDIMKTEMYSQLDSLSLDKFGKKYDQLLQDTHNELQKKGLGMESLIWEESLAQTDEEVFLITMLKETIQPIFEKFDSEWKDKKDANVAEYHDTFRHREVGFRDTDTEETIPVLHSLEETLEYLNRFNTSITFEGEDNSKDKAIQQITEFWEKYPTGLITFY